MYCYHCGKKFDERALEKKQSSYVVKDENGELQEIDSDAQVQYVCPRCGHLTHYDLDQGEIKSLSQAAHSQLQRAANSFARGMALVLIGVIIAILAVSFLLLSFQTSGGARVLNTGKSTFYIFVVMAVVAIILLVPGVVSTVVGVKNKSHYTNLLKDLNNKTFIQQLKRFTIYYE